MRLSMLVYAPVTAAGRLQSLICPCWSQWYVEKKSSDVTRHAAGFVTDNIISIHGESWKSTCTTRPRFAYYMQQYIWAIDRGLRSFTPFNNLDLFSRSMTLLQYNGINGCSHWDIFTDHRFSCSFSEKKSFANYDLSTSVCAACALLLQHR